MLYARTLHMGLHFHCQISFWKFRFKPGTQGLSVGFAVMFGYSKMNVIGYKWIILRLENPNVIEWNNNPGFIFPPAQPLSKNLTIRFFASVSLLPFSGAEPESQWYVTIEQRGWPKKASYVRVEGKEAYLDYHPTIFSAW